MPPITSKTAYHSKAVHAKCCGNTFNWRETQDPKRYGWMLTECKICGAFIGYREKPGDKHGKSDGKKQGKL